MPNTAKKRPSAEKPTAKASTAKASTAKARAAKPKASKRALRPKTAPKKRAAAVDPDLLAEQIELLRPALRAHGGDIELVRVEGSRIVVRLTGACAGCPMAQLTLKQGVEKFLVKRVPGVAAVEAVPLTE